MVEGRLSTGRQATDISETLLLDGAEFSDLVDILDTSLLASFEIAPPIGDPIPVVVEQNSRVDGPLYGGGATLVVGHGSFFATLDANYARSDLELFDGAFLTVVSGSYRF